MKIHYKGAEAYNTRFGGFISLLVRAMTCIMIMLVVWELCWMKNPLITSFTKPLSLPERASLIPLEFDNYKYIMAVKIYLIDKANNDAMVKDLPPRGIGRIWAEIASANMETMGEHIRDLDLVNCTSVLAKSTIKASNTEYIKFDTYENVLCLDPSNARTSKFSDKVGSGPEFIKIKFQTCEEYAQQEGISCNTMQEREDWFMRYNIKLFYFEKKTKTDF